VSKAADRDAGNARNGRARWSTTLWLAATGGRADRARIALTAAGAAIGTVALTSAATVAAIGPHDGPYTSDLLNQSGLRPGVATALILLCVPILAFVGQCARIGAPARDRRLASLRLQGATPGDVVRVAACETGLSAMLGTAIGLALFFVLRILLNHPVKTHYTLQHRITMTDGGIGEVIEKINGPALRLPTDALPSWPALLIIAVLLPLTSALFTALALRRVAITPFGVVRQEQHRPAQVVPAMLFLGGTAGMACFATVQRLLHQDNSAPTVTALTFFVLFLVTAVGLLTSTSALSAGIGRLLAGRTRSPALLLAGRRLTAAPYQASRVNAALLFVVLLWAFTQGFRVQTLATTSSDDDFYARTLNLINVGFAAGALIVAAGLLIGTIEGVISRRRTLAAMSAVGIPRRVLQRAVLAEAMMPLVPTVILAATAGILGARGMFGSSVRRESVADDGTAIAAHVTALPIPWLALSLLVVGTLTAILLASVAALPLLSRSIDPGELRAS
jgi:hypothetical protein